MPWVKDATGRQHWEDAGSSHIKGEGTYDAEAVSASQREDENRKKLQAEMRKKGTAVETESAPSKGPDESLGDYAERLKKWKESNARIVGQKKALSE